jgi:hypothetical protein
MPNNALLQFATDHAEYTENGRQRPQVRGVQSIQ